MLVILGQFLQGIEQFKFLLFGPLLVLLVMFFPSGIAGGVVHLSARLGRRTVPIPESTLEPRSAQ